MTLSPSALIASVVADLHISTPPCISRSSKGFGDPAADVFRASAAIHDILIANNRNIKVLVENAVPHDSRCDPGCAVHGKTVSCPIYCD